MSSTLLIAPCDHAATKYAVEHWHYSRSLPTPPIVKFGAWEEKRFIGVVLFSRGASDSLHKPYGLQSTQVCELTRIALTSHSVPVSQIATNAIRALKTQNPGLRLIVSYSDPNHGHHGGIYQAMNWIYAGRTAPDAQYVDKRGRVWHSRQVSASGVKRQYGEYRRVPRYDQCRKVPLEGKHRYLYPLDRAMHRQIQPLAQPYPRAVEGSEGAA